MSPLCRLAVTLSALAIVACSEPDKLRPRMDAGDDARPTADGTVMPPADGSFPQPDRPATPSDTAPGIDRTSDAAATPDAPSSSGDGPRPAPDGPVDGTRDLGSSRKLGQACSGDADCQSGHCADKICCDVACAGKCSACAMASTGKPDGTCAPVTPGADPRNDCDKATDACGDDGECDGTGACRKAGTTVTCGAESCTNGTYTPTGRCDGKGACTPGQPVSCGVYACAGTRCKTSCTGPSDCPSGFYCANSACTATRTNGGVCGGAGECSSGNCVEGVCCDGACTGKCSSCLQANTGRASGQCAPVKAGGDPHDDCAAADKSTCGLDGACDGGGACRKYASGTICRSEMCADGATSSSYAPAGQCDGGGNCNAGATTSCGLYVCAGTKCKAACSTTADCISGYYCGGTTCAQKKDVGSVCAKADECQTGLVCGGRCCTTACVCTQPSSANVLKNPGFDSGATGWTLESNAAASGGDATDCPFSGSLATSTDATTAKFHQCAALGSSRTYNAGFRFKASRPFSDWSFTCNVGFYASQADCEAGNTIGGHSLDSANAIDPTTWQTASYDGASAPANATYGGIDCFIIDEGGPVTIWFDQTYVTPSPGKF